ncbi:MAG TPA: type II toxin-antitoxin system Phd/YefM family antitoxin [Candidatus Binataceae bacterium]|nr:type II toxin-antitoxin system Phd/YefM family antitoxin [Candidatus Binataceae bacterium]
MTRSAPVNIHDAKTHFSRLLKRVMRGEEVIIARAGHPVARLCPLGPRPGPRIPGSAKGRISIASDFDAPIPELERAIER